MLTLSNVSAGYGGADVIRNISMQIKGNISIIGPNGCGKTTLLKTIANILPSRGKIELFGKPFSSMKRREISLNIAMLSQQPSIYFAFSVFDTVMMGRYLHIRGRISDSPTREDNDVVTGALEAVNLLEERDRDISKLSGGQLQRVFLARALAQEPRIILLDEPTNHLDLKCQIEIIAYLKKWAQEGNRAVVGVMHDINLAMRLSDNFIVMKNGEIQADGNVDEIIADGLLDDVYGMDVAAFMHSALDRWHTANALPFKCPL
ncbi:MAG: ABC transporter ATP-binding protein [Defluviitaleaceae bacterium]|nr:ABC transporter ATP-binding protein [Defluviitaleaceae bacterium]MCL2239038.1 ABC transporter ATP-binding protein [Defluviitaleaceae bacterium]